MDSMDQPPMASYPTEQHNNKRQCTCSVSQSLCHTGLDRGRVKEEPSLHDPNMSEHWAQQPLQHQYHTNKDPHLQLSPSGPYGEEHMQQECTGTSSSSSPSALTSRFLSTGSPLSPESGGGQSPGAVSGRAGNSTKGTGARPHVLPPCKVCESPATGFHYGVNTCEACKGFFRRSIIRKEEYVCAKSTKCTMQKGKRNVCASCRYQRCLAAGMSKEGIKTGRYTYEKRTSDILELKRLHSVEAQQHVEDQQDEVRMRAEELIKQIVRAQESHHKDAGRTNPIIEEIHSSYLEKKRQEEEQAPESVPSRTATHSEFMTIYQHTGVEVDNRRKVMEAWIATAERGLKQMVNFAKDLPGFNELPLPDQIMLLKNSIAEAWVITRHRAFNVEHAVYTAHNGFTFDIRKAFDPDFVDVLLAVVQRLQRLELTHEETCVLKATAFFFSDRCTLMEPHSIDALQMSLVEALTYLIRKNHADRPHMLAHLILIMTDLRTITEMYHKHNEKVLSWTDMKRAPLIWEVMSYSQTTHAQGLSSSTSSMDEVHPGSSSKTGGDSPEQEN